MDIQEYLDNAVKAERNKTFAISDQLTLGEIISKLEAIINSSEYQERIEEGNAEPTMVYDFEYFYPTEIYSWRGSYSELALDICSSENEASQMKITDFLKMLKKTIGEKFTGYKGGEFTMSRHTPVWVANYGNSGNTGVVDIKDNGYEIIIITAWCEF